VLYFLSGPKMPPAWRQIGDMRHVGECNYTAVIDPDAELALSLEGSACHFRRMWEPLLRTQARLGGRLRARVKAGGACAPRTCPATPMPIS
jgi:hypothetical protein